MSSSYDISGSSGLSSISIDAEDEPRASGVPRSQGARPGTFGGRVTAPGPTTGRALPSAQKSASSIEISGSDLSGSIDMDHYGSGRSAVPGRSLSGRPTPSGKPKPAIGGRPGTSTGRPPMPAPSTSRPQAPARQDSDSSIALSGLGLSGSIDMDEYQPPSQNLNVGRPSTSGRPPPAPGAGPAPSSLLGRPSVSQTPARAGPSRPAAAHGSDSFSISSLPEDMLADLDVSGDAADRTSKGGLVEVLSFEGPKARRTTITRVGPERKIVRESTHTVTTSDQESFDLSGSLDIEHSVEVRPQTMSRPGVTGLAPPPPARYASDTPSISGSSFGEPSSASHSSAAGNRTGTRGRPAADHSSTPTQSSSPQLIQSGRATGSARLSRPQSIGGLTAEPVFASGSSRSAGTPSISSDDSSNHRGAGADTASTATLAGRRPLVGGAVLLDSSDLQPASGDIDYSYDRETHQSTQPGGTSDGVYSSWDRSPGTSQGVASMGVGRPAGGAAWAASRPGRSGSEDGSGDLFRASLRSSAGRNAARRLGDSGGASSSHDGSSTSTSSGLPGINLRGIHELEAVEDLKGAGASISMSVVSSPSVSYEHQLTRSSQQQVQQQARRSSPDDGGGSLRSSGDSDSQRHRRSSSAHRRSSGVSRSSASRGGGGSHRSLALESDPLAGMEVRHEDSSSSSSGRENILTLAELEAAESVSVVSVSDISSSTSAEARSQTSGGSSGNLASGNRPTEQVEASYDADFTSESVASDSTVPPSASSALQRQPGSGTELSFNNSPAAASAAPRHPPGTVIESRSDGSAHTRSDSSRDGSERRSTQAASKSSGGRRSGTGEAVTIARPQPPQRQSQPQPQPLLGSLPDPRVGVRSGGVVAGSSMDDSYGSVDEEEDMLASSAQSPGRAQDWQHRSDLSYDPSSPSLGRRGTRTGDRQSRLGGESASSTFDASHLSHSGPIGALPVAPGWTIPAGQPGRGTGRGTGRGEHANRVLHGVTDQNMYSKDSDLSEEFIPSQGMQRGLVAQPDFRPIMPNVTTPRASIGTPAAVPAFTAGGTPTTSSPEMLRLSHVASFNSHPRHELPQTPTRPSHTQPQPPPPQVEELPPAVAAAASPPPPRQCFSAKRADVYANEVDLDPMPRPGTVKLRSVAMQWGTLNEVATQVAFDPVSERLMESGAANEPLPLPLRHHLQHHLEVQQQMYGPFNKRSGAGGLAAPLLQAGADSLLGETAPFSGIGPGFGILSLAFHSVKTAALLEQLERSLSSAATASGLAPPPPYPPHMMQHPGMWPYYPYGMPPPPPGPGGWPPPHPTMTHAMAGGPQVHGQGPTGPLPSAAGPPAPAHSPSPAAAHGSGPSAAVRISAVDSGTAAGNRASLTAIASSTSLGTSHMPLSPPMRMRTTAPHRLSVGGVNNSASAALAEALTTAAASDTGMRRERTSSTGSAAGAPRGALAFSPSVGRYVQSALSALSGGSPEYTADFEEDIVEEEEEEEEEEKIGEIGSGMVAEEIPEEDESIPEEDVDDGSIPEESVGGSTSSSTAAYSEDFEADSQPPASRSASFVHRSSLIASTSRAKISPLMLNSSFSGRTLLRKGSVLVSTLAPITGSPEANSREDEEDGSPSPGSRMLSRVGSLIKSSSGFKRTESISITMAGDPMLPNQMSRIIPTFNSGPAAGAGLATQPSSRRLSTEGAIRGTATAAASAGHADAAHGSPAAGHPTTEEQQQRAGAAPYPYQSPYYPYPYPPYPYGMPYGMPYSPPPAPPGVPAAANVGSVLQYLPPPIPVPSALYPYPPYGAAPHPAAATQPHSTTATEGTTAHVAAVPTPAIGVPGLHSHHQNLHVKFADGSHPGTAPRSQHAGHAAGAPAATAQRGTAAGGAPPTAPVSTSHAESWTCGSARPQPPGFGTAYNPPAAAAQAAAFGLGAGGLGFGSGPIFSAQSTLQRFGAVLSSGAYPGLDPLTVRTIRSDLVKTAAAMSDQVGYEDIVAEQCASDEYRAQLARVRARLAAVRASMKPVVPSQDKEVFVRIGAGGQAASSGLADMAGPSRILSVSTPAEGSYRYTTLEETRRLINATLPYAAVGAN